MKKSTVYDWIRRFREGRTSLEDNEREGRPKTAVTEVNSEKVRQLILNDRRVTVREIQSETGLCVASIHHIIHEELHMRKLTARWVPRLLTEDHKMKRLSISKELLSRVEEEGDCFWKRMITMDETWLPHYNPETKSQSRQWCGAGDMPPVKARTVASAEKIMMSVFWDTEGVLLVDFLEKGATINSEYYCSLLKKLRETIRFKRRGKLSSVPILHHDNATPHTAKITGETVEKFGWEILPHPPYSPDLAPSDFFLFGALKKPLRGRKFQNRETLIQEVSEWLKNQPKSFFETGITTLAKRWHKCVRAGGGYIEKFVEDEEQ